MSRMYNQTGNLYKGVFDCLYKTVKTEGLLAIYKGFPAHLARILPHTVRPHSDKKRLGEHCADFFPIGLNPQSCGANQPTHARTRNQDPSGIDPRKDISGILVKLGHFRCIFPYFEHWSLSVCNYLRIFSSSLFRVQCFGSLLGKRSFGLAFDL